MQRMITLIGNCMGQRYFRLYDKIDKTTDELGSFDEKEFRNVEKQLKKGKTGRGLKEALTSLKIR